MIVNPDLSARVRSLRKKLTQIAALEASVANGQHDLSAQERAKVSRRDDLERELDGLLQAAGQAAYDVSPGFVAAVQSDLVGSVASCNVGRPRLHSSRWEDDPVAVEDVALPMHGALPHPIAHPASSVCEPLSSEASTADGAASGGFVGSGKVGTIQASEIFENVQPFGMATRSSPRMAELVRATTELSLEAFGTDVVEGVSRQGRWKLTLLARTVMDNDDPWRGLLGFMAYKLQPHLQCLSIAKLAVVPEHRGKGHGHSLVNWCIAMAKKQSTISFLSLTSLPKAVRFYKQIGFRQVDVDLAKLSADATTDGDESPYIEDQVYMEYNCKGRGGRRRR